MCENTEGSKGLLFPIHDSTSHYKSCITLCPTSAVCPPDLSPSFPSLLSAYAADSHGPLSGIPELWLLVGFGRWEAPAGDPENGGE